jgi:hypothetical protein
MHTECRLETLMERQQRPRESEILTHQVCARVSFSY